MIDIESNNIRTQLLAYEILNSISKEDYLLEPAEHAEVAGLYNCIKWGLSSDCHVSDEHS